MTLAEHAPHSEHRVDRLQPESAAAWFARGMARLSRADWVAGLLLAAQGLLVLWVSALGGPYRDDFRLQSMAVEEDVLWWAFRSPESHFAPIPRFIMAAQAYAAPWDTGLAAATTVLLFVVQGLLMWLLLRELLGPRRLSVGLLLVYAVCPIFVPSMGWWTQAVTLTPATIGMLGSLLFLCRYWRRRAWGDLMATWGFYAFGLLSWEKALLTLPAAAMLTLLFLVPEGSATSRLRAALAAGRLWAGMVLLTAAHLVYYLTGPFDQGGDAVPLTPLLVVRYLWTNLTSALLPGLVGGPWRWNTTSSPHFGIADPSTPMVLAAVLVVLLTVAVAVRRSPSRTGRALLLIASVWLPSTAMLLLGRVTKFGLAPALDYRYLPEVAAITVVALGLALQPGRESRPGREQVGGRLLAVLLLVTVMGASVSWARWASAWHENPARAYAAGVIDTFEGQSTPLVLFDADVPTEILSPLFNPYNQLSRALAPFDRKHDLSFDARTPPANLLDEAGRPVSASLEPVSEGRPGPVARCGYPLNPESTQVTVPLVDPGPALPNMFLRVGALAGAPVRVQVTAITPEGPRVVSGDDGVTVPEGLAGVLIRLPSTVVTAVALDYLSTVSGMCVDRVTVGVPVPLDR